MNRASATASPSDSHAHEAPAAVARIEAVLREIGRCAIAVSGGVDSLTLGALAHRALPGQVTMFHAVSPAVPGEATQRVRGLANEHGWALEIIDAGEFADADYRRNPANRCFYCKTNLYGAIAPLTTAQILSGTNVDDLGEYRPGLEAAKQHGVRHPFVEAGIDKATVRAVAVHIGLGEIAELPAAPCLSSRVETGIAIESAMLKLIHEAERLVRAAVTAVTVRCRVRASGIVIELDAKTLAALAQEERARLGGAVRELFAAGGYSHPVRFAPYRNGSAFLVRAQP
jgi:pyridinium-3,5-biscarboxylic acid mononucleotide sulfurtransferase